MIDSSVVPSNVESLHVRHDGHGEDHAGWEGHDSCELGLNCSLDGVEGVDDVMGEVLHLLDGSH